jgi:hypothetical protein
MLIETVAKGFSWLEDIVAGRSETVRQISQRNAVDEGDVSRMIGLAFLAPDIVDAIVYGRQPLELTTERLKRSGNLPYSWDEQRRVLGFAK